MHIAHVFMVQFLSSKAPIFFHTPPSRINWNNIYVCLDLSRLLPVGVGVVLEGRDECCGVPGGMGPGVAGGDGDSIREEWA